MLFMLQLSVAVEAVQVDNLDTITLAVEAVEVEQEDRCLVFLWLHQQCLLEQVAMALAAVALVVLVVLVDLVLFQ
jgi:hypothetical protein